MSNITPKSGSSFNKSPIFGCLHKASGFVPLLADNSTKAQNIFTASVKNLNTVQDFITVFILPGKKLKGNTNVATVLTSVSHVSTAPFSVPSESSTQTQVQKDGFVYAGLMDNTNVKSITIPVMATASINIKVVLLPRAQVSSALPLWRQSTPSENAADKLLQQHKNLAWLLECCKYADNIAPNNNGSVIIQHEAAVSSLLSAYEALTSKLMATLSSSVDGNTFSSTINEIQQRVMQLFKEASAPTVVLSREELEVLRKNNIDEQQIQAVKAFKENEELLKWSDSMITKISTDVVRPFVNLRQLDYIISLQSKSNVYQQHSEVYNSLKQKIVTLLHSVQDRALDKVQHGTTKQSDQRKALNTTLKQLITDVNSL